MTSPTSGPQDAVGSATQLAVTLAVRAVGDAHGAAVSVTCRDGTGSTLAASDDAVRRAADLQHVLGEGPCLSAAWHDGVLRVPDARTDRRWPRWSRAISEGSPYRSVLVSRLYRLGDRVATLDLYSREPHGFDRDDVELTADLAAHVATTIGAVQEVANLRAGLDSRTVLGQATGMLMERYGIDANHALAVLTRLSSHRNRKMRDLAEEITRTGTTSGLSRPARVRDHTDVPPCAANECPRADHR